MENWNRLDSRLIKYSGGERQEMGRKSQISNLFYFSGRNGESILGKKVRMGQIWNRSRGEVGT